MGHTPHIGLRWDDARFSLNPGSATNNQATITTWQTSGGISMQSFQFSGSGAMEELHGVIQLPHSYAEGGMLMPHVHIGHKNAGASGVARINMDYWWANVDGTATPGTTYGDLTCAAADANKHLILSLGTLTGTGKTISSILRVRFWRDSSLAADTYTGAVWFLDADCHYQIDTVGSKGTGTKA